MPGTAASENRASHHVRRICLYIRGHYGEQISLTSLAARVGRNSEYLATLFRRETGTTIHRYLTSIRMQRAATLLRRAEKVEVVMLLVGYRSKKNFYRQFEAVFGVTPGRYKSRHSRPAWPAAPDRDCLFVSQRDRRLHGDGPLGRNQAGDDRDQQQER